MKIYLPIIQKFYLISLMMLSMEIHGQLRSKSAIFDGQAAQLCQERGVLLTRPSLRLINLSNVIPAYVEHAITAIKDGGQQKALLFHGVPGTGKNYTTEAMAGELDAYLLSCDVPKMAKKFVGSGTDLTDAVFAWAEHIVKSTSKYVVIFFDEIDTLSHDHDHATTPGAHAIMKQLGIKVNECNTNSKNKIIVVVATNRYNDLLPEFKQRFDKCEFVMPTLEERERIIRNIIDTKMQHYGYCDTIQKTVHRLAAQTNGFCNRNLRDFIDDAFKTAQLLGCSVPDDKHFVWSLYKKRLEVLKDAVKQKPIEKTLNKKSWLSRILSLVPQGMGIVATAEITASIMKFKSQYETNFAALSAVQKTISGGLQTAGSSAVKIGAAGLASTATLGVAAAAPGIAVVHCIGFAILEAVWPTEFQTFTHVERELAIQSAKRSLAQSRQNAELLRVKLETLQKETKQQTLYNADRLAIIQKYVQNQATELDDQGVPLILQPDLIAHKSKWGEEAHASLIQLLKNAPEIIAQARKNLKDNHAE